MNQSFDIGRIAIAYFGFLVALVMREAARAHMARYLGDNSPEMRERATINPLPHIDVLGTVLFPLIGFSSGLPFLIGWAKPVNFDTRYFKNIKRDFLLVTLAGPVAGLLIIILCGILLNVVPYSTDILGKVSEPVMQLLMATAFQNIVLGLINIMPFPGSDGWRLLLHVINYNTARKLQEMATPISIGFLVLFVFGVFSPLFTFAIKLFVTIFGVGAMRFG
jgi:Zn-dependent protease